MEGIDGECRDELQHAEVAGEWREELQHAGVAGECEECKEEL